MLGLLAPAQFLAVAEEAGLIAEIGWTVLDQACRDMAGWVGRTPLDLNVNSPRRRSRSPIAPSASWPPSSAAGWLPSGSSSS
jgi:EAL domain-containing protein (putative c-di-GMP-specific phosphodiesterase class I)